MSRSPTYAVRAAVATALVTLGVHAQDTTPTRVVIQEHVGLAAVDHGVLFDDSHAPATSEGLRRDAVRSVLHTDGVGASGVPYARGRLIVKFRNSMPSAVRVAAVASLSRTASIATRPSYADFDIVTLDPSDDAEAAARVLSQRADVEYAQAAYRVHAMFVPNDPLYESSASFSPGQWNLGLIGLERAWDIQPLAGSTITVAVLDTGLAYMNATITATIPGFTDENDVRYPALGTVTIPYSAASQIVSAGRVVAPRDFIWDTSTPLDFDGHGTHVAGTIGQLTNDRIGTAGVAFNVKLMPVKVIDGPWDILMGAPNSATDDVVARGIRYAADSGAKVINMSIGREGPPDSAPAIEDAIRYAVGKGAFIAIAAGNAFDDGNPLEVVAEIASRVQGAVSVAAVDRNALGGDRRCRDTSDSPGCHAFYSGARAYVELAAPGGSGRGFGADGFIWQQTFDFTFTETYLNPPAVYVAPRFDVLGYLGFIGTSMATPHVAGLAAMVMQQGITDPAAIEAALERFATDLGPPGRDDLYGDGLIDARNTLRGLGIAK